ncbi:hypothetical protein ACNKHV_19025 [Shigella flexneri]
MQILPVAVIFRYRTFQESFIPLASRPLLLFLVQEYQMYDIIIQSRKLLKEQLIYIRINPTER